jgi:hypothetical protein
MYLRYVQIARKLEQVHDNMLQPQKRADVRIVLDSCLGRMLEMKHQIVTYCGEYVNLDEALVDLKLTPSALEIPIPKYFVEDREKEIAEQRKKIMAMQAACNIASEPATDYVDPGKELQLTLEKAIEIIQANERGRQGRQRAKFLKSIYEQEQHQKRELERPGQAVSKDDAATRVQKIMRGYLAQGSPADATGGAGVLGHGGQRKGQEQRAAGEADANFEAAQDAAARQLGRVGRGLQRNAQTHQNP